MKRTLLILTLALCALCLQARTPRLSYGLEWGYTGSFLRHCDYSFICSEGYRIVEHEDQWRYFSNGSVLANVGLDLTRSVNLSVYSGLLGVWARRWMVPVELRARYCPAGLHADGLVCHAGAALNFPTNPEGDLLPGARRRRLPPCGVPRHQRGPAAEHTVHDRPRPHKRS